MQPEYIILFLLTGMQEDTLFRVRAVNILMLFCHFLQNLSQDKLVPDSTAIAKISVMLTLMISANEVADIYSRSRVEESCLSQEFLAVYKRSSLWLYRCSVMSKEQAGLCSSILPVSYCLCSHTLVPSSRKNHRKIMLFLVFMTSYLKIMIAIRFFLMASSHLSQDKKFLH